VSEPQREPDYCPRCGAAYEPLQEYCLECGARLPTNRGVVGFLASEWQRRLAWYPGDWIWPVLAFLLLTVAATAGAVAAASRSSNGSTAAYTTPSVTVGPGATQGRIPTATLTSTLPTAPVPTVTTGPLPVAPGSPSTGAVTTPAPVNPNALATWPSGKSGFTDVLLSLPLSAGRGAALGRARQAKQAGVPSVGVLVSSDYSSLHPGYYVVFSGTYGSAAEATAALGVVHAHGYRGAYQARVTR
jgi:hypothetical protein